MNPGRHIKELTRHMDGEWRGHLTHLLKGKTLWGKGIPDEGNSQKAGEHVIPCVQRIEFNGPFDPRPRVMDELERWWWLDWDTVVILEIENK